MGIALTKSRKVLFKKNNQVYPGFNNLSGSWDEFSTSGLCTFSGTIDIIKIYENPTDVDNRENRIGWIFGTEIEILVEDDNGDFVKPKLLPKLFIKNSKPYNPQTRILTLDVSCVLGLLSDYTLEHWKNPEKDAGNPDNEQEIEYWWSDWEKKGETTVSAIVSKIFQKLQIQLKDGQSIPSTKVLLPWTPSGGLIAACGDLCFKSNTPSILYSDENGLIKISEINVKTPARDLYLLIGRDEKDYQPTGNDSPISELVAVAEIPEEKIEELSESEDGFCTYWEETGLDYAIGLTSGDTLILVKESVCEHIVHTFDVMIKTVTTIRHERLGLVFPDAKQEDKIDFIKSLEKKQIQHFDKTKENRLFYEEIVIKEPWGRIFGGWYNNHLDYYIDYNSLSSTGEGGSISPFADEARFSTAFFTSRKEETNYYYNEDKTLRKTETIVKEPISKILTSFNGDGVYKGFDYQDVITEKTIEEWVKYRKNERHTKTLKTTMEAKYSSTIEALDTELRDKKQAENPYIPDESSSGVIVRRPNLEAYMIKVKKFERPDNQPPNIGEDWVEKNFVNRRQRLTLVGDTDNGIQVLSRTGEAAPPPTENIPNNEGSDNPVPEYENKIFVDRHEWEFPYPNFYRPPREFSSIGTVRNKEIARKIGEILYFLRQGKSFSYEVVEPLTQYWIESEFKPLQRIDIDEPDKSLIYIGNGFSIELGEFESLVLSNLYWLGFN